MLLPRIDWFVIVDFLATFTARLEGPFRHAAERHPINVKAVQITRD